MLLRAFWTHPERCSGPVQTLGYGAHDEILHRVPSIDHLRVAHPDHVVPEQPQCSIVCDVRLTLSPDVVPAIDLQYQPVPDQEVDAVPGDPDLPPQGKAQPQQARHDEGFEPRIGPGARLFEHLPSDGWQRHPSEYVGLDEPLTQRQLLAGLAEGLGVSPKFVTIPAGLVRGASDLAQWVGVSTPGAKHLPIQRVARLALGETPYPSRRIREAPEESDDLTRI